ncbi:MAG TPA: DUF1294 domain-containing protein [Tepidisphaeraceae bacterium]|jgi:uncharacterized membrane protein YsdA (DUF1294 family)
MTRSRSTARRDPFVLQCGLTAFTVAAALLLAVRWAVQPLIACLLAINVSTFLAYAYDKWASTREGLRLPERSLHLLAAFGGSPAALAGQQLFRHKTRKRAFQIRFWLTVAVQILVVVVWLLWVRRSR